MWILFACRMANRRTYTHTHTKHERQKCSPVPIECGIEHEQLPIVNRDSWRFHYTLFFHSNAHDKDSTHTKNIERRSPNNNISVTEAIDTINEPENRKKPVLLTKSFTIFRTKLSSALYFFADKSTFSLSSSPFKDYCNHQSVLNFVCVSAFRFTPRSLSRSVSPVYVWLLLMLVASIK